MIAIAVVALIVVSIISTTGFIIQMSLIKSGGWKRINRKGVVIAAVLFTASISATIVLWAIMLTHLTVDGVGVPVGILLTIATAFQMGALSMVEDVLKKLASEDQPMSLAEVLEQAVRR